MIYQIKGVDVKLARCFAIILSVLILFSFAACKGSNEIETPDEPSEVQVVSGEQKPENRVEVKSAGDKSIGFIDVPVDFNLYGVSEADGGLQYMKPDSTAMFTMKNLGDISFDDAVSQVESMFEGASNFSKKDVSFEDDIKGVQLSGDYDGGKMVVDVIDSSVGVVYISVDFKDGDMAQYLNTYRLIANNTDDRISGAVVDKLQSKYSPYIFETVKVDKHGETADVQMMLYHDPNVIFNVVYDTVDDVIKSDDFRFKFMDNFVRNSVGDMFEDIDVGVVADIKIDDSEQDVSVPVSATQTEFFDAYETDVLDIRLCVPNSIDFDAFKTLADSKFKEYAKSHNVKINVKGDSVVDVDKAVTLIQNGDDLGAEATGHSFELSY